MRGIERLIIMEHIAPVPVMLPVSAVSTWTNKDMSTRIHRQLWRGIVREGEENVGNGPKLHPAQKPIALMAWCIGFTTGQTICDPYMGCGTTGAAAIRARRKFIGIEKDPAHFESAVERIKRESAQGVML